MPKERKTGTIIAMHKWCVARKGRNDMTGKVPVSSFGTDVALHSGAMVAIKKLALTSCLWAVSNEDGTFIVLDSKGRRVSPFGYSCIELITPFAWVLGRKDKRIDVLFADNNWIMGADKVQEDGDVLVVYNKIGVIRVLGKKDEKLVYLAQENKEGV